MNKPLQQVALKATARENLRELVKTYGIFHMKLSDLFRMATNPEALLYVPNISHDDCYAIFSEVKHAERMKEQASLWGFQYLRFYCAIIHHSENY